MTEDTTQKDMNNVVQDPEGTITFDSSSVGDAVADDLSSAMMRGTDLDALQAKQTSPSGVVSDVQQETANFASSGAVDVSTNEQVPTPAPAPTTQISEPVSESVPTEPVAPSEPAPIPEPAPTPVADPVSISSVGADASDAVGASVVAAAAGVVSAGVPSAASASTNSSGEKRTIMVVEDDMFISDIYDVKLSSAGYNVVLANNGRDAVEKMTAGERPHLMLLDIVMPYMDGFDVLEAMSKNPEWLEIPVVLLTNLSQKEDIDRAMERGAKDYLIKSHFTPSEVLSKVERYIRKD